MFKLYEALRIDLSNLDRIAVFAMIYTAFALTCVYYLKETKMVNEVLANTRLAWFGNLIASSERSNLPSLAYWAGLITLFYFVIPAFFIKIVWNRNLSDFGLSLNFDENFIVVLLQCLAVMLPIVFLVSLTSSFADKYPFLKIFSDENYLGYTLLIWELIYFFQFFGTEFFFRGFIVQSLKPTLGIYSIFVMTIPYCMIHFGKPPLEAFAAILAGVILGWLSYTSNSIWLGLALHCSVALAMDLLALYHKKLLF